MTDLTGKSVIIISDVHYGMKNRSGSRKFLEFLRERSGVYDCAILLGDIFDLLYTPLEKRYGINKELLSALGGFAPEKHFIPGNHDFWGRKILIDEGYIYHERGMGAMYHGKKYFFHHGDGFNPVDIGYIALKALTQRSFMYGLSLIVPPVFFLRYVQRISRTDRFTVHSKEEVAFLEKNSFRLARHYGYDGVILGHSHFPVFTEKDGMTYMNSGDWIVNFSYIEMKNGALRLARDNELPDTLLDGGI